MSSLKNSDSIYLKALRYVFLLLKYRMRTEAEITRRLRAKKFSVQTCKRIIRYLKKEGYINDKEFVMSFIGSSIDKGRGQVWVFSKLMRLGISKRCMNAVNAADNRFMARLCELIADGVKNKEIRKFALSLERKGFYRKDISACLSRVGVEIYDNI